MPAELTPAEQQAIEAYRGPITVCPARTYTPDEQIQTKHHNRRMSFETAANRERKKAESTKSMIRDLHFQEFTPEQIAKKIGMSVATVLKHMREMGL